jgi:serine/threonine protein kinase
VEPWPSIVKGMILGVEHVHTEHLPHKSSIKHKDLKPDNILYLDESEGDYSQPRIRPIIADLGISKEDIVRAKTTKPRTYQNWATEQHNGKRSSRQSDIFSLGCCLTWIYACVCSNPLEDPQTEFSKRAIGHLEEMSAIGFGYPGNGPEILCLLEELRRERERNLYQKKSPPFLLFLEKIIEDTLKEDPKDRPTATDLRKGFEQFKIEGRARTQRRIND